MKSCAKYLTVAFRIAFVLIIAIPIPQWFPGFKGNVDSHDQIMEMGSKPSIFSVRKNNSDSVV